MSEITNRNLARVVVERAGVDRLPGLPVVRTRMERRALMVDVRWGEFFYSIYEYGVGRSWDVKPWREIEVEIADDIIAKLQLQTPDRWAVPSV